MQLLDLGISGAMLAVLVWIVKAFLSHLKNKDEVFSSTINNHLTHDLEAKEKLIASNERLSEAIGRLENKL